jgi:hypothetical protein
MQTILSYNRYAAGFSAFGPLRGLALLLCLLSGLLLPPGCASRHMDSPRLLAEQPDAGTWIFRHKVRLDFPGRNRTYSFDGLMRLDTRAGTVHAVGVAGLGMQLFDISVTRDGETLIHPHPSLAKMPDAAEHMGRCIRQIWLDFPPDAPHTSRGDQGTWSITASGGEEAGLWPRLITYTNKRVPFTLVIRLLQVQQEDAP